MTPPSVLYARRVSCLNWRSRSSHSLLAVNEINLNENSASALSTITFIFIFVVAMILQITGIWNDFLLGLIFAGRENYPMTVQLNNIINSTQGEKLYNVNMAATLLASMVPLVVYFISGR